jgi:quinol monooxygenase YgiN
MNNSTAPWPLAEAESGEIVVIARWQPSPGTEDTIATTLDALVTASRAEAGCLGYGAYHPDGGEIIIVERYSDREAAEAHRRSDHFQRLALEQIVPLLAGRNVAVTAVT